MNERKLGVGRRGGCPKASSEGVGTRGCRVVKRMARGSLVGGRDGGGEDAGDGDGGGEHVGRPGSIRGDVDAGGGDGDGGRDKDEGRRVKTTSSIEV